MFGENVDAIIDNAEIVLEGKELKQYYRCKDI
jgi:hypothetical protein